ncbi:hypothetical protein BDA99DRAFT_540166 [Phascolomyces articulosus]|uniref:Uncharacterized protein n=1 Tax=Phascolomyces articulosus TaxID=60185 RepID=A0AAD5K4P8_9FUNG|nr:hypothetical protein BDA99DRAFT_540166 [Phascolomyces articulosus]
MINARQAECGANGNTDTICSPLKGETWENSTWHQITWNPSYPTYAADEFIDIYLYYVKNYQNTMIKNWTNVSPSRSNYPVFIDDTWFPISYRDDDIHEALIYIVGVDVNPDQEMTDRYSDYPAPIPIQVIQTPKPTTATNNTAINDSDKSSTNDGTLQPWVIAIVVIAIVAAVIACIVMIWAIRHVRRRKLVYNEKGHEIESAGIGGPVTNSSSLPSSSMMYPGSTQFKNDSSYIFPPIGDGSIRSQPASRIILDRGSNCLPDNMLIRPQSVASCSNISTPSTDMPPISSADALMIADTFRQRMRRPEWQQQQQHHQQQQQQQQQKQEHNEESKRRQLSEELLKKELAAEGTLMKKVGKRAQLLSAFAEIEDEDDADDDAVAAGDSSNDKTKNNNNSSSHS